MSDSQTIVKSLSITFGTPTASQIGTRFHRTSMRCIGYLVDEFGMEGVLGSVLNALDVLLLLPIDA